MCRAFSSYASLFTIFVRRDFWFAALLLWMIPFAAIWSSTFTADFNAVDAAALSFAVRTFLTTDRMRVISALFRACRRALLLIRFAADLCCGIS